MDKKETKEVKVEKTIINDEMKQKVAILLMENGVNKADATRLINMTEKTVGDKTVTIESFFSQCLENRPFLVERQPAGAVVMTPELSRALDRKTNPTRFGDTDK